MATTKSHQDRLNAQAFRRARRIRNEEEARARKLLDAMDEFVGGPSAPDLADIQQSIAKLAGQLRVAVTLRY